MERPWRVATRRSALARAQAAAVADALAAATRRPAELVPLATTGDQHPDRAVEAFDRKGLFVDGVRAAVLDGRCDLAVHSYKDLPSAPAPGLVVAAIPRRVDPRDALVTATGCGLAQLPPGARVGTSSPRRRAQLAHQRPDLELRPLRGNVDTRLRRVATGELDAVVVAVAGLLRLEVAGADLPQVVVVPLEHGECLHAPAQGALAVECRVDDAETRAALAALDDAETRTCVAAERALLVQLGGGCTAPIGAHAEIVGGRIRLLGMVADPAGTTVVRAAEEGDDPDAVAAALAGALRRRGAARVLTRGGR